MQCEGWRRHGGAFTLGPVTWVQCDHDATVIVTVKQDGEIVELPGCQECWQECLDTDKIEVISVKPLHEKANKEFCTKEE